MMEAEYEDARGKTKILGPRTPMSEVIEAGEVKVVSKAVAQQRSGKPAARINGARTMSGDSDFELESGRPSQRGAVAVKVAPRPVGTRASP